MNKPKELTEEARVEFLHSLNILDTAQDEYLDRIVSVCRDVFDVPISDISLIDEDRQWFKAMQGLDVKDTKRKDSFCNITIENDGIFEVPNAAEHEFLKNNPYVVGAPFIRYYMGAPITISGYRIGALCIMDTEPKSPAIPKYRAILLDLAAIAAREIHMQHLVRKTIPVILSAASTTSTMTGTGTVVSEGTGVTTTTGTGTTTTTGTGTVTTTGTGTVTSTGSGTTTSTGTAVTTSTGTGSTTRTGDGTTESTTSGLEDTTTNDAKEAKNPPKKTSKKKG